MSHETAYDTSSGAKVIILFEKTKSIHIFLFLSLLNAFERSWNDCGIFCGTSQKGAY
jgi:hypothetical protein